MEPFGPAVNSALPDALTDSQEASKCIALDRPTAAVFHLMRVMEHALQRFGKKLGVRATGDMMWQAILNSLSKPIAALPDKTKKQKAYKSACAETASHLYHVKLAWRNPTMHPKGLYSSNEAAEIYDRVGSFLRELVKVI